MNFISNPPRAGWYQLGGNMGLRVAIRIKPNVINRTLMLWLLGWAWVDDRVTDTESSNAD